MNNFKPQLMQAFVFGRNYQRNEVSMDSVIQSIDELNDELNSLVNSGANDTIKTLKNTTELLEQICKKHNILYPWVVN